MKKQLQQNYLRKRRLRFLTLSPVLNLFPGEFSSIHKGVGEDFVDLRPYQPGDDARRIHWPYYARTRELFVIEREVQKNLTIIYAIDLSQSMYWSEQKISTVDAFFGILIGSLVRSGNNSLGCLGFSNGIEAYFPPRAGQNHFTQILRWYLEYTPKERLTNIPLTLSYLIKRAKRKSIVFFVSDFFEKRVFSRELRVAAGNFDFVPVVIRDPKEFILLPGTKIEYRDAETGETEIIWLTQKRINEIMAEKSEREQKLENLFRSCELEPVILNSPETKAVISAVRDFFKRRSALIRRR